jgi:hypothetical protein
MVVQFQGRREMQAQLNTLRALIARYRRHLEESASQQIASAYVQAIHISEAEIAEIERRIADLPHSESIAPEAG